MSQNQIRSDEDTLDLCGAVYFFADPYFSPKTAANPKVLPELECRLCLLEQI